MGAGVLALDNLLSATLFFAGKWTPDLRRNQSRDLLRYLVCKLYDQSRGKLNAASVTVSQSTLARKMGISRQWVGTLLTRLRQRGWIEFASPILPDGMRGSTVFRMGPQLQRVFVMLLKSKSRNTARKSDVKNPWQFSPSIEEKRIFQIQEEEKTLPRPETFARLPLLKLWLGRTEKETSLPYVSSLG